MRERMRLGPEELGGRSVVAEITVRRYRCLRCMAVLVVCPRGVLPRLRYGAVAVALALALWSVEDLAAAECRSRVSPFEFVGDDACRTWRSLRRWARGSPWCFETPTDERPRQRALHIVQWLAGHSTESGPLTALACAGALLA